MGRSQLSVLDAIERHAESSPQALGLVEPDGLTLNYRELWAQIEAFTHRLEAAGIGAAARVAILLPQGALQVLAFAAVSNRHVAILLQTNSTSTEVESSLRKLCASALITSPEFEAHVEVAIGLGLTVVVALKEKSPKDWQIRAASSLLNLSVVHSEARVFLFSSGTTGTSKVLFWTAANINAGIASRIRSAQFTSSDRLLLMITLCNGAGIINLFTQFSVGGVVIATGGFDPSAYVHWLNDLKPTWYVCAPVVHQAALAQLKPEAIKRPVSLRFLESAGAPLPEAVREGLEQILEVPLLNVYGANEAQYIVRDTLLSRRVGSIPNLAGVSCGLEIRIIDSAGRPLPPGEEGEIAVRGATVVSGYVDNPQATRDAFHDDWFWTGDVGRLDTDGNLYVTGRLKEMINRGGEKIVPAEVDAVLETHPAVLEAAAFAVPHPSLGEDVACAVVLRSQSGANVTAIELRRYAAERLASYKVPRRICFVDQIPRGELGKPQRWMLAETSFNNPGGPPTPAEVNQRVLTDGMYYEQLHEIWARILDRIDLGYNEDFFEAGGDSLAAVNMLAEVDRLVGCNTSAWAASFLDEPTLEHLTSLVGLSPFPRPSIGDSSNMQVFPVRKCGTSRQLFCLPTEGHEGLYFRRLATHLIGKLDLSIVRPANVFHHTFALFSMEAEGKQAAEAIRREQPEGPYFVGGYCYGGVVAVEAARQLLLEGRDVKVFLFEVPTPGSPRLLLDWPFWIARTEAQWRRLWTSDHPGITKNLRRLSRRIVWSALVPFRRLLAPIERFHFVRWFLEWSRSGLFPLYKPRPVDAQFLHILCTDEPSAIESVSRFGWRRIALRGVEERFLPQNHQNILHESNLPEIARLLEEWTSRDSSVSAYAAANR